MPGSDHAAPEAALPATRCTLTNRLLLIVDVRCLYAGAFTGVTGDDFSSDSACAYPFATVTGLFEVAGDRRGQLLSDDQPRLA